MSYSKELAPRVHANRHEACSICHNGASRGTATVCESCVSTPHKNQGHTFSNWEVLKYVLQSESTLASSVCCKTCARIMTCLYTEATGAAVSCNAYIRIAEDNHIPCAKADAGKTRTALVLGDFAYALEAVSQVGTFGAAKYSDHGWLSVPNAQARYEDAMMRHWIAMKQGVELDEESQMLHLAHMAWNALAILELQLRAQKQEVSGSTKAE